MAHKTPFLVADLGPDVEPFHSTRREMGSGDGGERFEADRHLKGSTAQESPGCFYRGSKVCVYFFGLPNFIDKPKDA